MLNLKIAKIFGEMAEYYTMKDDQFRPRAYERAARLIEGMEEDLEDIYKKGGTKALMEIQGIGQGLAEHIEEYVKTGKIKIFEKLKHEAPLDLESFSAVEGVGPKMLMSLYKNLKIKNLKDLEKAAREGKVRTLPRFGEKTEENILRSIELSREHRGRFLLGYVSPIVSEIEKNTCGLSSDAKNHYLRIDPKAQRNRWRYRHPGSGQKFAGNHRILCLDAECRKNYCERRNKIIVRLDIGIDADLRVVPEKSFGAAMQYFTGNKDHNVELRKIAIKKGWKLNEYGLFDKNNNKLPAEPRKKYTKNLGSTGCRRKCGKIEEKLNWRLRTNCRKLSNTTKF